MSRIETLDSAQTIDFLKKLNVIKIQIGLQTINPKLDFYMRRKEGTTLKLGPIKRWLDEANILCSIDVIAGLPKDTLKYFKETLDFAVSLNPSLIQIKQLYLNPNTFFYFHQKDFGIRAENFLDKKLVAPLVVQGEGIGKEYYQGAFDYSKKSTNKNLEIGFKIIFEKNIFYRKNQKIELRKKGNNFLT